MCYKQFLWCLLGEFGIGSTYPLINIYLYSHHFSVWYCIDIGHSWIVENETENAYHSKVGRHYYNKKAYNNLFLISKNKT